MEEHQHPHHHVEGQTTSAELLALVKYMVAHNAAHTKELEDLAKQIQSEGDEHISSLLQEAITDYRKGNAALAHALEHLEEK